MRSGPGYQGHYFLLGGVGKTGVTPSATVTAYDPVSGRQAWHVELPGSTNTGNLVTAGDLIFQGVGTTLYVLEATTGKQLHKITSQNTMRATPMTYQVNGRQYVAVAAASTIQAFGLPD